MSNIMSYNICNITFEGAKYFYYGDKVINLKKKELGRTTFVCNYSCNSSGICLYQPYTS